MRVLHVIPGLSVKDGGPTTALHKMAAATAASGADVTVATTDDDAGGRRDVPLGRPVAANGAQYWYFARTLPGSWKASLGLTRWLAENIPRFDVVHVHALFSYATIPACRFAFRAGVPVVLRPLGTASPWSLNHHGWKKRPYYNLIERAHLRGAAAIHTTSEAERSGIVALGFGERAVVIPLGIDVADIASATRPAGEPFKLLFLSRLHEVKNIPMLLDSVADLHAAHVDVRLTIAGDGAPEYRGLLAAAVRRLGIEPLVRFIGHADGEAKRELFVNADAYVLPSFHENFGISAAEALGAGLPVVLSDQVGLAADVERAGAGLVVPLDRARLTAALASLARDRATRLEMGTRALGLARERFSWDTVARRLIELYEAVQEAHDAPVGTVSARLA